MKKITRFEDVPRFVREGSYEVDFDAIRVVEQFDKWERGEDAEKPLQTNPDFQRGHVWTGKQQAAYLEFFFRGGKTARTFYLNYPSWHGRPKTEYDDFVLVDGLQRLTAFRKFFANEVKMFGSYYREFTDEPRLMLTKVKVNVNDLQTKAEVLEWYLGFNSGGTVHTEEELDRVRELLRKERGQ